MDALSRFERFVRKGVNKTPKVFHSRNSFQACRRNRLLFHWHVFSTHLTSHFCRQCTPVLPHHSTCDYDGNGSQTSNGWIHDADSPGMRFAFFVHQRHVTFVTQYNAPPS